ncbi:hypothetical protein MRX96_030831 [Rhipicephalus microplus]
MASKAGYVKEEFRLPFLSRRSRSSKQDGCTRRRRNPERKQERKEKVEACHDDAQRKKSSDAFFAVSTGRNELAELAAPRTRKTSNQFHAFRICSACRSATLYSINMSGFVDQMYRTHVAALKSFAGLTRAEKWTLHCTDAHLPLGSVRWLLSYQAVGFRSTLSEHSSGDTNNLMVTCRTRGCVGSRQAATVLHCGQ